MNNLENFLSSEQLSFIFGISSYTLKNLTETGIIPYRTDASGHLNFVIEDIISWLSQKEEGVIQNAA